jgi:hypothetical protein
MMLNLLCRYYDQDLALARDLEDRMSMGRAYCNLGLAHLAIGNMDNALECQKYFLGKICTRFREFWTKFSQVTFSCNNFMLFLVFLRYGVRMSL